MKKFNDLYNLSGTISKYSNCIIALSSISGLCTSSMFSKDLKVIQEKIVTTLTLFETYPKICG